MNNEFDTRAVHGWVAVDSGLHDVFRGWRRDETEELQSVAGITLVSCLWSWGSTNTARVVLIDCDSFIEQLYLLNCRGNCTRTQ